MATILKPFSGTGALLANGYALVANTGLTSVLGIVFWMLATRLYTQEQVGLGAALISSMTTISYLSQMNLGSFLTRFIPISGRGTGPLILKAYAASAVLTTVVATGFALGVGAFAAPLEILRGNVAALGLFVAATVIWTIFALQDAVLSGLRRSVLVPVENLIFSVLKIGILVLFAMLVIPAPGGVFLAWTLPLIPLVVAVNALIFGRFVGTVRSDPAEGLDLRTASRFLGWDFLGSLALAVGFGIAPILVTAKAGVESTATYHLAWSFAYSVYLVGRAMSVSLVAEGATHPMRLPHLVADTLLHTLLLVAGAVVVLIAAAPMIMTAFGQAYVTEGVAVLRVLVLSCLPWSVTTIYCAAARARGQTYKVALVQIATLAVFVALSAALISGSGALGVAIGWLGAHSVAALGIVAGVALRGGREALFDWALALAGSAARLIADGRGAMPSARKDARATAARQLGVIRHADIVGLVPLPLGGSRSEVESSLLVDVGQEPRVARAVMKHARSERGRAALGRNAQVLARLATDDRLRDHRHLLPRVLVDEPTDDGHVVVETAIAGVDGRHWLGRPGSNISAMTAVASVVAAMHRRTATRGVLDDAWAQRWIDDPVRRVAAADGVLLYGDRRAAAFDSLRQELRDAFLGRAAATGLGHGDLWPGNLFFLEPEDHGEDAVLSGIIDWDTSRDDALAALDLCHLALTFRMEQRGEELGPVLRDLFSGGGWSPGELAVFDAAGVRDDLAVAGSTRPRRAMVLLTWLHHVATVLEKTDWMPRNSLWAAVNVDSVLTTATTHGGGART